MITQSKAVLKKVNKAIALANKRNKTFEALKDHNLRASFVSG